MRALLAAAALLVSGCASDGILDLPTRADPLPVVLPPMKTFADAPPQKAAARSNAEIARDYLDLVFRMESGREIERMSRFDGPIRIAAPANAPERFLADLDDLIARFRTEAGLPVSRAKQGDAAEITIQTLPRKVLQAAVPHAACFVVPRVSSWDEFRKNRRTGALDWSTLERRERAAVFIPEDVSPQEARDCLHEEIAQALGPLNDIYRLADSVYNDDNINTALTPFDMLILRVHYDSALKNGMTRAEAAREVPAILARLNPSGEGVAGAPAVEDTGAEDDWTRTIEAALGGRAMDRMRMEHARRAVALAEHAGWTDNRLGFSYFVQGRLALGVKPELAIDSFNKAYDAYVARFGPDDIHTAHVALQLAAFSLSDGRPEDAIDLINGSLGAVARAQNAALMASLLMVKAAALDALGRREEGRAVRLDSLGWARYGFASEDEIRLRLNEVAGLDRTGGKPEV